MARPLNVKNYLKTKNFLTMGIIVAGLLSLIIAIIAYFGQNLGNFVITLPEDTYRVGIKLSDERDFYYPRTRLVCDPIIGAEMVTYKDIEPMIDTIRNHDGQFFDDRNSDGIIDYDYFAYTFYLKNDGTRTVDITFDITISTATKNLDGAIRLVIFTEEKPEGTLYQKEDLVAKAENSGVYPDEDYWGTDFDGDIVCRSLVKTLARLQIKKFTILIWIEGNDPDSDEGIAGGKLRMDMYFRIVHIYDEKNS
jgi:hypothetical protein